MMRKLDIPATAEQIAAFLKQTVSEAGFSRVAVAVSGGIDSAVSVTLATRALGPQAVFPLFLPYKNWHTQAALYVERLLLQLAIPARNIRLIDIAPIIQKFTKAVDLPPRRGTQSEPVDEQVYQIRLGNIMARTRMILLFDHAREQTALVLGTENKSEHYLGCYTRFGDEASDIEPLRNLYKTEIYQLAKYLGVPEDILKAAPTAGLWPEQTDEGQFGFTYAAADPILYGLYDANQSPQQLVAEGLDAKMIERVQSWVRQVEYKHDLPRIAPEPVSKE